jgi:hypothetical protein
MHRRAHRSANVDADVNIARFIARTFTLSVRILPWVAVAKER